MIPISQYETFLLLIGAVFVPLFGVVLSDYYIIKHRRYENTLMYGNGPLRIGFPAIIAWLFGLAISSIIFTIHYLQFIFLNGPRLAQLFQALLDLHFFILV
jgi:purine-cytosine permease-like protein